MQFKTASLVAFAAWFAGAANASVLGARAVTVANVFIHPVGDSTLCVTPSGFSEGNPVVFSPCTSSASQNPRQLTRSPVPKRTPPRLIVTMSGCLNSDGSGRPVSNTEFDTAPQSISRSNLPMVVTALNNRLHFSNTGFCMESSGSSLIFNRCNGVSAAPFADYYEDYADAESTRTSFSSSCESSIAGALNGSQERLMPEDTSARACGPTLQTRRTAPSVAADRASGLRMASACRR
ncbi:hypothetical protein C8J57DRAFT_1538192 [Mycena rebaudengoi]|nr:hypothetical protein C8J57DRAFT_1538192 [Mycena rebaudengoi]